ncbi:MAG: hypothetical protein AAFQ95_24200 [Cyanobacteria bacterium J06621_3]
MPTKSPGTSMVQMWLAYAKEFVGESTYLKRNRICVNYSQWCADTDYRRELSAQLEIPFSDAGLDKVSSFGGGSSFDGIGLSSRAKSMSVTDRWRQVAEDPTFKQLFLN